MLLCSISGFLLAVVAIGLVSADMATVVKMKKFESTVYPNDYWDKVDVSFKDTKTSAKFSATAPNKKQLPDNMIFKITAVLEGGMPLEYQTTFCEGLDDDDIGKSIIDAGLPKGEFPHQCPFPAGNHGILDWYLPVERIPPVSDGPVTGQIIVMEEGKDPYIVVNYEAQVSHALPGMLG